MHIIINNSSMQPIYEQIVSQIKDKIIQGELKEEEMLPSVRTFAKELKVSALTVKKAYDALEEEGFVVTVHGKGSFVTMANQERMLEAKVNLKLWVKVTKNWRDSDFLIKNFGYDKKEI